MKLIKVRGATRLSLVRWRRGGDHPTLQVLEGAHLFRLPRADMTTDACIGIAESLWAFRGNRGITHEFVTSDGTQCHLLEGKRGGDIAEEFRQGATLIRTAFRECCRAFVISRGGTGCSGRGG
eukprot:scaffold146909_cov27-Tisochrysis_lutea.AAC.2